MLADQVAGWAMRRFFTCFRLSRPRVLILDRFEGQEMDNPPFECGGTGGGTRRVLGDEKNDRFQEKRPKRGLRTHPGNRSKGSRMDQERTFSRAYVSLEDLG